MDAASLIFVVLILGILAFALLMTWLTPKGWTPDMPPKHEFDDKSLRAHNAPIWQQGYMAGLNETPDTYGDTPNPFLEK
jgi:hypothetical protein